MANPQHISGESIENKYIYIYIYVLINQDNHSQEVNHLKYRGAWFKVRTLQGAYIPIYKYIYIYIYIYKCIYTYERSDEWRHAQSRHEPSSISGAIFKVRTLQEAYIPSYIYSYLYIYIYKCLDKWKHTWSKPEPSQISGCVIQG